MRGSKSCSLPSIYLPILHPPIPLTPKLNPPLTSKPTHAHSDFNTRFSGISPADYISNAVLTLDAVRLSLDAYINSHTILIGHALDNDLKTLRMMHHRCVDTAILFLHRNGWPFRRALRDL